MRVAIDLLIAEKEPDGMFCATHTLLDGLTRIDQTNEYIVITGHPEKYQALADAPNMRIHTVRLQSRRGILTQRQLLLPDVLRRLRPTVLHVPTFAAPIGWNGPLVITVHDLAPLKVPRQSSLHVQLYWQYVLRESAQRAQRIIAVSEQTCKELLCYQVVEPQRIRVIPNALRPSLRYAHISAEEVQAIQQRYGRRYLLHVDRIMPRKNIESLVQAFDLLAPHFAELHLVLIDDAGSGSEPILQQIEASSYCKRIHLVGRVPDEDLGPLYTGASTLVCFSRQEGFDLPIVEAMACGTPVVASSEAASLEIAGEAVVRVDCTSASVLAEAIAQVLTDAALRERLIRLGQVQTQPFTREACAIATRRVYQEALNIDEPQTPLSRPTHERAGSSDLPATRSPHSPDPPGQADL